MILFTIDNIFKNSEKKKFSKSFYGWFEIVFNILNQKTDNLFPELPFFLNYPKSILLTEKNKDIENSYYTISIFNKNKYCNKKNISNFINKTKNTFPLDKIYISKRHLMLFKEFFIKENKDLQYIYNPKLGIKIDYVGKIPEIEHNFYNKITPNYKTIDKTEFLSSLLVTNVFLKNIRKNNCKVKGIDKKDLEEKMRRITKIKLNKGKNKYFFLKNIFVEKKIGNNLFSVFEIFLRTIISKVIYIDYSLRHKTLFSFSFEELQTKKDFFKYYNNPKEKSNFNFYINNNYFFEFSFNEKLLREFLNTDEKENNKDLSINGYLLKFEKSKNQKKSNKNNKTESIFIMLLMLLKNTKKIIYEIFEKNELTLYDQENNIVLIDKENLTNFCNDLLSKIILNIFATTIKKTSTITFIFPKSFLNNFLFLEEK